MSGWKASLGLAALGMLWVGTARSEDLSGFVWQTDREPEVRQAGAVLPGGVQSGPHAAVAVTAASEHGLGTSGKTPGDSPLPHEPTGPARPRSRIVHPARSGLPTPSAKTPEGTSAAEPRVLPQRPPTPAGQPHGVVADRHARQQGGSATDSHSQQNPFLEEDLAEVLAAGCAGGPGQCACCGDESCLASCQALAADGWQDPAWRLLATPRLDAAGITIRGWLDQGFTWNPDRPGHRFNGPVTFNDRANEYQLNQLYLIGERVADNGGWGFAWGGRVDVLYGTDSRFLVAYGLEDDWNQSRRFYGAALPQVYADFAFDDLLVRIGHFYTILGYESPMAPENFFYSHSYTTQYGQPFTHTGILARFKLNDCWSFTGAVHRGWNQWEDNNDKAGFLFGIDWTSPDQCTFVKFAISLSNEQLDRPSHMTAYSVLVGHRFSQRFSYVFQTGGGDETDAVPAPVGYEDAEWYSIANYLLFELNPCWGLGLRYEWFGDYDGTRVIGLGAPKGIPLRGVPAHWNELAVGVAYRPNANVLLRSELRWDWANAMVPTADDPFDTFSREDQFLWATDLVVRF
ncbi:MAG: outer membrane beta-barrel protein [Thermoguttaceae bacterium]